MSDLTAALIHDTLDAGGSVADIAEAAGVSPSRVYQAMRRLGRPASQVRAKRAAVRPHVLCTGTLAGYAVAHDGTVLSCIATRTGETTPHWRPLAIQRGPQGRLYVQLGSSTGGRRRLSPLTIYRNAFGATPVGEERAEKLFARVKKANSG